MFVKQTCFEIVWIFVKKIPFKIVSIFKQHSIQFIKVHMNVFIFCKIIRADETQVTFILTFQKLKRYFVLFFDLITTFSRNEKTFNRWKEMKTKNLKSNKEVWVYRLLEKFKNSFYWTVEMRQARIVHKEIENLNISINIVFITYLIGDVIMWNIE